MSISIRSITSAIALSVVMIASSCKEKENEADATIVDDGAAKSEITETGQRVGSTTDSTTVISDEPNPSND